MSALPNFEGHTPRDCGEHRTAGPHRAWCLDCKEWCYPQCDAACEGCYPWHDAPCDVRAPTRARLDALARLDAIAAEIARLSDETGYAEAREARVAKLESARQTVLEEVQRQRIGREAT